MRDYDKYAEDVAAGKVEECKLVKLACERHLHDLDKGKYRGLKFDRDAADLVVDFVELLPHVKGQWARGKEPIRLEPWQKFFYASVFGWKGDDGFRRFRSAYLEVARKNSKSTMAAGLGLYMLSPLDGEEGAEVYTFATKKDQAKVVFGIADAMVKKSPHLRKIMAWRTNTIHVPSTFSIMQPLPGDSDKLDGLNTHCGIGDEGHAWKTDALYNVVESSMGSRLQPLMVLTTTAGFNRQGPCFRARRMVQNILQGVMADDSTFGLVYTLDDADVDGDVWENPLLWRKSNPNLGVSVHEQFLKAQLVKAKNEGVSKVNNFKTKYLNLWTSSKSGWISDEIWMANESKVDLKALADRPCFAGLDLSSKIDVTALVLLFPPGLGEKDFFVVPFFWVPEDNVAVRTERDGVGYQQWVSDKLIRTCPGNAIDDDFVIEEILSVFSKFKRLQALGYDDWNMKNVASKLMAKGLPVRRFVQGIAHMNEPCKELEKLATQRRLRHSGNSVLRWMNGNVELVKNPQGNMMIDRGRSQEKVDGMVALAMAIGEWITFKSAIPAITVPAGGLRGVKMNK